MASMLKKKTKQEFIDEYQFNTILHTLDLKAEKYKKINNKVEYERWKGLYDWLRSKKSILTSEN